MSYDFDRIIDRKNTASLKWDYTKSFFGEKDVLPLWVADMDFKAPPEVIEALNSRVEHGVYGYSGKPNNFYESIINWMNKKHNWQITKEWISVTPGVVPAINLAILALTEPNDKIIVQTPVYFPFFEAIKNNGRKLVNNPLIVEDNKYKMNFKELEEKIDEDTKMIILCSPHNPVGRVWSQKELSRLVDICIENDILIISDEIHSDIVYKGYRHIPIASLSQEAKERTITFMAPSKTFNVAGLSTAYSIIPNRELRSKFNERLNTMHLGLSNIFGTIALESCYTYGANWLDQLKSYLESNIEYTINYIKTNLPEIKLIKPEGTYLLWLDFKDLELSEEEIDELLIKKAKVALNKGTMFGEGGEFHRRLNIGCPRRTLEEALYRIKKAIHTKK
ncbi:PatB family C-S lyase [Clostridium sp. D2Q-11]|uniref:cysteine-S-conjugate beta-lyase n=1 Tax=Anaeromonas frigoriresistens TaxID=2683708 RepID=A0A942UQ53_9FIRM|nr:PatB family C-S lyase [Anaeromonas frigoriresistens]